MISFCLTPSLAAVAAHIAQSENALPFNAAQTQQATFLALGVRFWIPSILAILLAVLCAALWLRFRRCKHEASRLESFQNRLLAMAAPLPGALFQASHSPGAPPRFLYVGPGCEQTFGFTPQELLDSHTALQLHPDDQQRFAAQWSYAAQPGGRLYFTGRLITTKGQQWCAILAHVSEFGDALLLYSGVMLDVSAQNQAEETLRQHESRFKSLAQNLPGAIYRCLCDDERTMLFISDGIQDLCGYPDKDFIGGATRSLPDIVHPDDLERMQSCIRDSLNNSDNYACTYRILRPDGSTCWIMDKGQALRNTHDQDDVLWLDGLLLDVSQQKQAERAMREAKETADRANNAKSEFLARMSHEIRTPMNAVLGMCHLTLQTKLDAQQRTYLIKLQNAARSLLGVINDVLDFSKIEAQKLELESIPFYLQSVLDNLETITAPPAKEKNLSLTIIAEPGVPPALQGDPLRLGQILINLTNNAVKFTEKGSVSVRVAKEPAPSAPDTVTLSFSVTDTGIGLSQEQIGRLFQSFTQADGSTTRKYGGTGLGLAICKRLVELMQGRMHLESTPGAGSCFRCSIPFALPAALPQEAAETPAFQTLAAINGARILVAEDNDINMEIVSALLEQAGLHAQGAANGRIAVEMALNHTWDAVIMDMQMPEMDGLEAARMLRSKGFQAPILAMTAHAMDEAKQQCLDAGMNAHLAKPIVPEQLYQTLLQWIPHRVQESAAINATEAAVSVPPTSSVPPDTPYVDTAAGLNNLGGNERLYLQLLQRFAAQNAAAGSALRQAMRDKDWEQARHTAHTLKGVAANLGADALAGAAANIEQLCAATQTPQSHDLESNLRDFEILLEKTLRSITSMPSSTHAPQTERTPVKDTENVARIVERLGRELDNDLAQAMRSMENLRPLLEGSELEQFFLSLEKALGLFDIEEAKGILTGLARALTREP